MMANKTCPLCKKTLTLHQINLSLAVYMCNDLKCKYPIGYDCIVIERKLEDIDKTAEVLSETNCDLDDWLDEVATDSEKTPSTPPVAAQQPCFEPPEQSMEWINNLVEEAVSKARDDESNETAQPDYDDILSFIDSK